MKVVRQSLPTLLLKRSYSTGQISSFFFVLIGIFCFISHTKLEAYSKEKAEAKLEEIHKYKRNLKVNFIHF